MDEVLPGIYTIPWFAVNVKNYYNGHYIKKDGVLIDPPKMDNYDVMEIGRLNPPKHIIITNKDHVRESEHFRKYFRAKVWIHESIRDGAGIKPDKTFRSGDKLPGGLIAVDVQGFKPGETALLSEHGRFIVLGDVLIGGQDGSFTMLGHHVIPDQRMAKESMKGLLKYGFDHVILAHGFSVFHRGKKAIEEFLSK